MAQPTRSKTAAKKRPRTFDHQKKAPLERRVPVISNDEVLMALQDARIERERAINDQDDDRLDAARAAIAKAEADVEKATEVYVCRAIGRKKFEALLNAHPASEEENQESIDNGQGPAPYAAESFTVALLQRCIVEPELTEEDAQFIYDNWSQAEIVELFTACYAVNTQRRVVQLGE